MGSCNWVTGTREKEGVARRSCTCKRAQEQEERSQGGVRAPYESNCPLTTLNQHRFLCLYVYVWQELCCCSNLALIKLADGARQRPRHR